MSPHYRPVGGYFTYSEPLSLYAYGASNNQAATANSAFSDNEALSGDVGSFPNEFIQLSFAGGIDAITIDGDPAGGSFTLDDLTFTSAVPETSVLEMLLTSLAGILLLKICAKTS